MIFNIPKLVRSAFVKDLPAASCDSNADGCRDD
jgi:hypothetical protein